MAKITQHIFDKPGNVQRVLYALYGCCAALFILDFIIHRHKIHPWEGLLGFYAVYGFVGCVVLVLVAKWMRLFLMRDEDYYDREELEVDDQQGGNHVGR
ncbi:MAG: hypothetical protein KJ630_06380 [Proteobacteria bacterium]|nr:hypothetical protein [Pseudomonadota bacterium]